MKTKLIITLLIIGLSYYTSYTQNVLDDFEYQITYVTTGDVNLQGDSIYDRECGVTLPDTLNTSKIHVKVGTLEGEGDVLNYSFGFDVTSGLPVGLAYFRQGNRIRLHLYETQTTDMYFYELKLEDLQGIISLPKKWH